VWAVWQMLSSVIPTCHIREMLRSHSDELPTGPPELVQHIYRGSSQRRKSAACPKFDMVWLYRSPIPVGRRWVI
jgi:hypothetical protein